MDWSFLYQESDFNAFTTQHYYPLLTIIIVSTLSIYFSKKYFDRKQQWRFLFLLSFIPIQGYVLMLIATISDGSFTLAEHLPVHACRFIALILPIVIWKQNRYWLSILYFWIMVGTLNASITPDIYFGFPNWNYFSYWILHGFLLIIPLYYTIVLGVRILHRDIWNAFWMANLYLVFSFIMNYIFDANYMYSMRKPESESLLSYLGEWPIYLFSIQLIALVLFYIVYLPFFLLKRFTKAI
jgi:hypothetical integral membrane protein (TIGR02206 family)